MGVEHHAIPTGRTRGEALGGLGVDGAVPGEECRLVALTGGGQDRNRDLHVRADRRERVTLAVRTRRPGQNKVSEDVCAQFVHRAIVASRLRAGFCAVNP